MGHSHGLRSGTRYAFSRDYKKHGVIPLSTYMRVYRVGDIVDIKVNGAVQQGSYAIKVYHGKTGVCLQRDKSLAFGVIIYKRVGNRYIGEARQRPPSSTFPTPDPEENSSGESRRTLSKDGRPKEEGIHIHLKRQPIGPREARTVSTEGNMPETITPIAYETTI
ncbi:60s ribosomal protein l21 [Histoplasma mississippiense (nom. inval.)]|uniref:60S ribosomal protein L21 n=1 Tax=Ajellomyces capsulatus (strain NAm1 / WU24) TaxID=2059318 RepID=UPI000157CF9D|nr:60S ribosomal protein L21 [Histoplasma mississippiense (nom. inval.)]EDN10787.1 60s ribosomal protein l21 [Histoplasma mississippiense (nom. inval.)]